MSSRDFRESLLLSHEEHAVREYRIVLLGAEQVGKSCLTTQFCNQKFNEEYEPTLEDSNRREWVLDGERVLINILDTSGNPEFYQPTWLRQGDGYLIVYDVTSKETFDTAINLIGEVQDSRMDVVVSKGAKKPSVVLVGNVSDVPNDEREVATVDGRDAALKFHVPFFETSARDRIGVDESFAELVREIRRMEMMNSGTAAANVKQGCCCSLQ